MVGDSCEVNGGAAIDLNNRLVVVLQTGQEEFIMHYTNKQDLV